MMNTSLKEKKQYLVLFIIIILVIIFILESKTEYYMPAKKVYFDTVVINNQSDTLKIGFIGDSWAELHQNHHCIINQLVGAKIDTPIEVRTAGISGLTSKDIYYSIYNNNMVRSLLMDWHPDYCIVAAGVNDSDRKMGVGYYKENMRLIIEYLLLHNIRPIILEIPYYNSLRSFNIRDIKTKFRYLFSMLIHFSKMDCIDEYRNVLLELTKELCWNSHIIIIKSNKWNPQGYKDTRNIYDDLQMHLNEKGYEILDSCIASSIYFDLK